MRCADFGPTPGRRRKASVRNSRLEGVFTNCFLCHRHEAERPRKRFSLAAATKPIANQNGSLKPGGKGKPEVMPAIFS